MDVLIQNPKLEKNYFYVYMIFYIIEQDIRIYAPIADVF